MANLMGMLVVKWIWDPSSQPSVICTGTIAGLETESTVLNLTTCWRLRWWQWWTWDQGHHCCRLVTMQVLVSARALEAQEISYKYMYTFWCTPPQISQICSSLRAFTHTVSSVWNVFPKYLPGFLLPFLQVPAQESLSTIVKSLQETSAFLACFFSLAFHNFLHVIFKLYLFTAYFPKLDLRGMELCLLCLLSYLQCSEQGLVFNKY